MRRFTGIFAGTALLALLAGCLGDDVPAQPTTTTTTSYVGQTRTYFIAADEVVWDYAPLGINNITGQPFDEVARTSSSRTGPDRIGKQLPQGALPRVHRRDFST